MLINLHPFGRLGNRLFLAAHLIAFSRKFELPLLNLAIGEYAPLFPWMEGNAAMAFPWAPTGNLRDAHRSALVHRVQEILPWSRRYRCWKTDGIDFDKHEIATLLAPLRRGEKVYFQGWLFRGYESVQKYHHDIQTVLRFHRDVEDEAEAFVAVERQRFDRLVGVHVRWEDYRGTENFLEPKSFLAAIASVRSLWPSQNIGFVLFSNETLDGGQWSGDGLVHSPGRSVSSDLALMSRCDLLMGPPSTFSAWSSFRGRVPLATLKNTLQPLTASDFQVFPG